MNIFYLDKCPVKAAQAQYNKHVVKMILESAQILCTVHHKYMGEDADVPYKATHRNHPSTLWAGESAQNYEWLYRHFIALCEEYTKRYGKTHMSYDKCYVPCMSHPENIPHEPFEQPPQCMPDEYKDKCSVQAYWNYYIGEKHTVANPKTEKIYERRIKIKN